MVLGKFFKKDVANLDLPPGTVIVSEQDKQLAFEDISISRILYNEANYERLDIENLASLKSEIDNFNNEQISWININCSKPLIVSEVGKYLKLHPLVQEDIVKHSPKTQS